jgi:hypothetical protein
VARDRSRTAACQRNRHNRRDRTRGNGTDAGGIAVVFRQTVVLLPGRFAALIAGAVMSSPNSFVTVGVPLVIISLHRSLNRSLHSHDDQ